MKSFILKIARGYTRDNIRVNSAGAAFYIIVSALPLAAILIFFLSCISPRLIVELESLTSGLLPKEIYKDLQGVLISLKSRDIKALVPFSLITALWGSTKGVNSLCLGIEEIYGVKESSRLWVRILKSLWRAFLFYIIIFATLTVFALGRLIHLHTGLLSIIFRLRIPIFALVLSLLFSLLFSHLSKKPFKGQLLGGTLASVGWMAFTFFYSIYVTYAINSVSIYAEMGTVIFFMLWVYFCVNIILVGAEINKNNG
ncbi:MAG: YihY/virulence factor BrkB family protein [Clostridia bacterium]|nr:YihY/virulence factor BrkB family protein [Clostridia bacterium]